MESILTSIKKLLGITEEDTNFDADIIMHINTVFMILNQLGVGPEKCFTIEDDVATWSDFVPRNLDIEAIKTYMFLKVKLVFDPPASSTVVQCMNQSISELEWRLHMVAESNKDE